MRINNQNIVDLGSHLMIRLNEPYWGAWKKYGWPRGIEGFGLSRELLDRAIAENKWIMISFPYGRYEITGKKAMKYAEKYKTSFRARADVTLFVIPRSACTRLDMPNVQPMEAVERDIKPAQMKLLDLSL